MSACMRSRYVQMCKSALYPKGTFDRPLIDSALNLILTCSFVNRCTTVMEITIVKIIQMSQLLVSTALTANSNAIMAYALKKIYSVMG